MMRPDRLFIVSQTYNTQNTIYMPIELFCQLPWASALSWAGIHFSRHLSRTCRSNAADASALPG